MNAVAQVLEIAWAMHQGAKGIRTSLCENPDWWLIATYAETLRINAETVALLAEQQIERQQETQTGPTLFGDYLPGDVADGVAL